MNDLIEELLDYFQMNNSDEEYPVISIYNKGRVVYGNIDDELYNILLSLKEALNE